MAELVFSPLLVGIGWWSLVVACWWVQVVAVSIFHGPRFPLGCFMRLKRRNGATADLLLPYTSLRTTKDQKPKNLHPKTDQRPEV